jgi:hypothetical protein
MGWKRAVACVLFFVGGVAIALHFVLGGDVSLLSRLVLIGGYAIPIGAGFWFSSTSDRRHARGHQDTASSD